MKNLLLTYVFSIAFIQLSGQSEDFFDHMREGSTMITFLYNNNSKFLDSALLNDIIPQLQKKGLEPSSDNTVAIGHYTLNLNKALPTWLFKSKDQTIALYIKQYDNKFALDSQWLKIKKWKGRYSGYESYNSAFYYLKFDSTINCSLNATFKTGKHIINLQKILTFNATNLDSLTPKQKTMIDDANTVMLSILRVLCDYTVPEKDKIFYPTNGRLHPKNLTSSERLFGFVQFWTEVKYNFAFFDHVPNLDWDKVLLTYLPRFEVDQSTAEYYDVLEEVCALLNDGHTNIYRPYYAEKKVYIPNVKLKKLDDGVYVVNTSEYYRKELPLGSKIQKVNGFPVALYLEKNLYPVISASTDYIKTNIALTRLMQIEINKTMTLDYITPTGDKKQIKFSSETIHDTTSWIMDKKKWVPYSYKEINKTAYLKLNTFGEESVTEYFEQHIDSINKTNKLIIDLRDNGGGDSGFGYKILKHLTTRSFITSKWMTREHKASYKAWGQNLEPPFTNDWDKECYLTANGNYWYMASPDTIHPDLKRQVNVPVVILLGNNTASAAEDFLIAAESAGITETAGELTFGSTGQPLPFKLPGGGSARICTKKDTYPDGREFVGYGIKPKYVIKPTINDVLKNRDVVLEFALTLK